MSIYLFILARYIQLLTVNLILYGKLANLLICVIMCMHFLKPFKLMLRRYWYYDCTKL